MWSARIKTARTDGLGHWRTRPCPGGLPEISRPAPEVVARFHSTLASHAALTVMRAVVPRSAMPICEPWRRRSRARRWWSTGRHDPATPPAQGRWLAEQIRGAEVVEFDAAHLSNVERAEEFNAAVPNFMAANEEPWMTSNERRRPEMRRAVLGDAHVDRAIAQTTPLTQEFQDLITRYAWGEIWTRPGLDIRSRRILVIGTHDRDRPVGRVPDARGRGAARRRLYADELKEIVLQQAIYCGVPAAHHALTDDRGT